MLMVGICYLFNSCAPMTIVKGNGNVITKEISITDYAVISASGSSLVVHYEQSEATPYLKVSVDDNIFEIYDFEVVDGDKLKIRPNKNHRFNTQIRPTEFIVYTNSRNLRAIDCAGSTTFLLESPLQTGDLDIDVAGSGNVKMPYRVDASKARVDIAGSGTIYADNLHCSEFSGDIAGSGEVHLTGSAEKAAYQIAGSGDYYGYDFVTEHVKADVAGSGNMQIHANSSIKVSVAGSGDIRYKGNATEVNQSIAGSGSVKRVD